MTLLDRLDTDKARGWVADTETDYHDISDLIDLVRWLALPYGDNMPVFATELPDGRPLQDGRRLAELYLEVVGDKRNPTPGAWRQCPSCRQWYVARPGIDRKLTGHDVIELGKLAKGWRP